MDNIDYRRLIIKYSWLLVLYYSIIVGSTKLTGTMSFYLIHYVGLDITSLGNLFEIIRWSSYLVNILIAILMFIDGRKYKLKNGWTIILTLLYIPIGVCVFFINIFYVNKIES